MLSAIVSKMSLSEHEAIHQLCKLERTYILQSLAVAVLKILYAGYLISGKAANSIGYEGNIFDTPAQKILPWYDFAKKRCY